jgi:hypothetical protein
MLWCICAEVCCLQRVVSCCGVLLETRCVLWCAAHGCCAVLRRALLYKVHDQLLAEAEQRINALMAMERDLVFTQNDHYMVSSKNCFEEMLIKQLYGNGAACEAACCDEVCDNGFAEAANVRNALANLAKLASA